MKRIALFLAAASTVAAHPLDYVIGEGFSGLHAGGMVGIASHAGSLDVSSQAELGGARSNSTIRTETCKRCLWGELYLGYGCAFREWFYFGARLGVNFSCCRLTTAWGTVTVFGNEDPIFLSTFTELSAQMRDVEPTLDLKPGLLCGDTMLYGLVGAAFNRVEANVLSRIGFGAGSLAGLPATRAASDVLGLRLGSGLEQLFCCRYGVVVSYVYTLYPTQHFKLTDDEFGRVDTTHIRPSKQVAAIGLSYYF